MSRAVEPATSAPVASIAAERTWLGDRFAPATVRIAGGIIAAVDPFDATAELVLPADAILLPALIDSHVHLNDPGRVEWEGFETGTAAAAAGGIGTVVDMPLNSVPVTTTPDAIAAKRSAAEGRLAVDVALWGGAVPENLGTLEPLIGGGLRGVKCFLAPSGIDEFGHLDAAQLEAALSELAGFDGLLLVHAEDEEHLGDAVGARRYADFLASRPAASERTAILRVIEAARRTGGRAHIVHLADAGALDAIRAAKADGVRLTVETCPHYLTLAAEDIPDAAPVFKCCPPIRERANQDLLWGGVLDGTIDAIVSDHSPSTPELKQQGDGDWGLAWGGISGVETGFSSVWAEASRRGVALESILPLMTTGPAGIAGIGDRGRIAEGLRADFAVVRPDETRTLDAEELHVRNRMSPWDGAELRGVVDATYLGGAPVYRRGEGVLSRTGRVI
ncbi:allantoinase AllB [Leucobacter iarius]|uniref:allantoinase n=1 Tax=Leucobacter iarius TaxID=333963 RepID=A0ABN2LAM3_9MICO